MQKSQSTERENGTRVVFEELSCRYTMRATFVVARALTLRQQHDGEQDGGKAVERVTPRGTLAGYTPFLLGAYLRYGVRIYLAIIYRPPSAGW